MNNNILWSLFETWKVQDLEEYLERLKKKENLNRPEMESFSVVASLIQLKKAFPNVLK